jgi:3-phosphoshikimate 1-carboxyvinyltransferase
MDLSISRTSKIQGTRQVPGDKSISHRALMIGAIADGTSEILSCSRAADPLSTLSCIRQLGLQIEDYNDKILIHGCGRLGLKQSSSPLHAGNSGTTIRLLSGILAGQNFSSILVGDSSLNQRPMKRIIDPLRLMGTQIHGTENDTAPLSIDAAGKLKAIRYNLPVPSAQVKSCLLFAGLYADGITNIIENTKTRDHTERMLGLNSFVRDGCNIIEVHPDIKIEGKRFFIPGDISAAAFILASGLIVPGSNLKILNVGLNPTRKRILDIFKLMGGNIHVDNERIIEGEPIGDLIVTYSELKSNIDLNGSKVVDLIDEIPILSVVAMFAEGSFSIHNASELRTKETDRISAMVHNLRLLGCEVDEYEDGFAFEGKKQYSGNILPSFNDHRIAMAFGVAGLRIPGVRIQNADCVDISFPNFWQELLSTNEQGD